MLLSFVPNEVEVRFFSVQSQEVLVNQKATDVFKEVSGGLFTPTTFVRGKHILHLSIILQSLLTCLSMHTIKHICETDIITNIYIYIQKYYKFSIVLQINK